jgi:hypothetical protein
MPEMDTDTPVAGVNTQPLHTDSDTGDKTPVESEKTAEATKGAPAVEHKDGKMFVDGVRVFTRDDTNKIAANARRDTEQSLLKELNVDDIKQVKTVVNQLQTANIDESQNSLDVNSLRDAVKKREQTVDELRSELERVKTDFVLTNHLSKLQNEMPSSWESEQKSAVIDLMKARDMFAVEGDSFAIRNGNDFLTTDGETPDYKSAVELVGKNLGLPFAKKGATVFDADKGESVSKKTQAINEDRIKSDSLYRNAYVQLRDNNKHLSRSQISDDMITKHMKKIEELRSGQLR